MSYICEYCGKTNHVGNSVSHAKNRAKRIWSANLRKKRVVEPGGIIRRLLCVKCARTALRPQDLKETVAAKK